MKHNRTGMLMVISGPSGTGKGTLANRLLEADPTFQFSVSVTTRGMRPGEVNGVHYHFISNEEYDKLLEEDAFLEHASVHGNRYGTLRREAYEPMAQGRSVLLDIDPQGALAVMEKEPDCVSVFILPPSMKELASRLYGRNTEPADVVERRLRNARGEIALAGKYDYIIVNDDLDVAFAQLMGIAQAEKQRTCRYRPEIEDLD